jgi:hypothetical protein
MNFLFITYVKYEVSHQVVFLEQTILQMMHNVRALLHFCTPPVEALGNCK